MGFGWDTCEQPLLEPMPSCRRTALLVARCRKCRRFAVPSPWLKSCKKRGEAAGRQATARSHCFLPNSFRSTPPGARSQPPGRQSGATLNGEVPPSAPPPHGRLGPFAGEPARPRPALARRNVSSWSSSSCSAWPTPTTSTVSPRLQLLSSVWLSAAAMAVAVNCGPTVVSVAAAAANPGAPRLACQTPGCCRHCPRIGSPSPTPHFPHPTTHTRSRSCRVGPEQVPGRPLPAGIPAVPAVLEAARLRQVPRVSMQYPALGGGERDGTCDT